MKKNMIKSSGAHESERYVIYKRVTVEYRPARRVHVSKGISLADVTSRMGYVLLTSSISSKASTCPVRNDMSLSTTFAELFFSMTCSIIFVCSQSAGLLFVLYHFTFFQLWKCQSNFWVFLCFWSPTFQRYE